MNIALIGCGEWGRNILRNLAELNCLRAVCDSDIAAQEFVRGRHPSVEVFGMHEDILEIEDIDAVCIATNAASHYTLAKAALEAGKDVFVEKPMAMAVPDAKELNILAENGERILMVGHLLLYSLATAELKGLMGDLGKLLYIHAQRMNFGDPQADSGVLWDLGPHEVSVLLHLMDTRPTRVKAYGHDFSGDGVIDFASLKMSFLQNVTAHIDLSWWYPTKVRRFVVVGDLAMSVWDDLQGEFKIQFHDKRMDGTKAYFGKTTLMSLPTSEPLRAELQHFIECCENRKRPLTDGRNGLEVIEVLAAAERSLHRQEWQIV